MTARERGERIGAAILPGGLQVLGEAFVAAPGDLRDQRLQVAEVSIGGGGADAGGARGLGEREPGRAVLGDQAQRGLDQCLAQIAMVVAFPHVRRLYIRWAEPRSGFRPAPPDYAARTPATKVRTSLVRLSACCDSPPAAASTSVAAAPVSPAARLTPLMLTVTSCAAWAV